MLGRSTWRSMEQNQNILPKLLSKITSIQLTTPILSFKKITLWSKSWTHLASMVLWRSSSAARHLTARLPPSWRQKNLCMRMAWRDKLSRFWEWKWPRICHLHSMIAAVWRSSAMIWPRKLLTRYFGRPTTDHRTWTSSNYMTVSQPMSSSVTKLLDCVHLERQGIWLILEIIHMEASM